MNGTCMKNKGFTLIETLVALAVLSTALIGVLSLIILNISNARNVEKNLIAANLAQEGIEVVRNMRDNDWHEGNDFGSFLPADGEYRVQWNDTVLRNLDGNPVLLFAEDSGMYGYDMGQSTAFKRKIFIEKISDVEIKVAVTVEWELKGRTLILGAESHLFDWL